MVQYKRYERYKDSGVEWLGEVPENWSVDRLKSSVKSLKNGVWGDDPKGNENDVFCVRVADFNRNKYEVETEEFTVRNLGREKQKAFILKKGDLLIEKSGGGDNQPVGFVVRYNREEPAIYANFMARMHLNEKISCSNFFKYVHSSIYANRINVRSIKQTTGIQNLDTDYYLQEIVVYPTLQEQIKISEFLDQKTAEIDSLITDKEKLIALSEKQRQAIITETVTKGLDLDVKMKDSGVEWIGKIPEHWEICEFRRISTLQQGLQIAQEERFSEGGPGRFEYITIKYLNSLRTELDKEFIENPNKRVICYPEEILLARTGATGVVVTNIFGVFHNNFFKVNFNKSRIGRDYLVYYLKQVKIQEHFKLVAGTTTIPDLNHGEFLSTKCLIPPVSEQIQIVDFLDSCISDIDSLITEIKNQINKLKEYRQSLIYEAVTGKINVRDVAAGY
ncbi:restriction endonuclease subunit S [Paenibacillus hunanensis]|uniref:Type I restriction enzyme S subunit n=1 Tax=Paenibacillus hunanensis TaxID=539262 RepID=A0ABU1J1U6_9BACL|nr:restriction endonuclease subunit S [Paenibacillus hunanensis]MDR6244942.1 type I restriction enzyme S subunit [Paenibacillus hunanensis]GGJ05282.1 type I restriction endonuclease subunit S [Paenibacillus hunanensis]